MNLIEDDVKKILIKMTLPMIGGMIAMMSFNLVDTFELYSPNQNTGHLKLKHDQWKLQRYREWYLPDILKGSQIILFVFKFGCQARYHPQSPKLGTFS